MPMSDPAASDPVAPDQTASESAASEPAASDPTPFEGVVSGPPASGPAASAAIHQALAERFGEDIKIDEALPGLEALTRVAGHRSHRRFLPRPVEPELLRLLCACALSAPSKSDLQQ